MQLRLDLQNDLSSPRGHQGNIAHKIQGIAEALFGVDQDASHPPAVRPSIGARKTSTSLIDVPQGRFMPAGFILAPAGGELALQQMQRGQIERGVGGVGVERPNALEAFFGLGKFTQPEQDQPQLAVR